MKFYFHVDNDLLEGVKNLAKYYPVEHSEEGLPLTAKQEGDKLVIEGTPEGVTMTYSEKAEFFYGLALCMQYYGKTFSVAKKRETDKLGVMRDCARNATLSVEGAKELVATLALIGYNYLELYAEDLMELKEYPHLGNARGRYTTAEIKEIDAYAASLGVELVPCIQTLAHLQVIFRSDEFAPMHDRDDILLADEEKTYEFIDAVLRFCAESFTSRRINIGMDEAQSMFLGQYLTKHGYQKNRAEVFLRHLNRVLDICRKYGFKASMWSDMIFKAGLNIADHASYINLQGKSFDPEFVKNFPQDVTLIFWDYYHAQKEFYDEVFERHAELTDNFMFAGGVWTWVGFTPLNTWSETVFDAAQKSGKQYKCKDYLMTSWGDNGGECSTYMVLSALAFAADRLYGGDGSQLNDFFSTLFGNTFDEFKSMENVNLPFDEEKAKLCVKDTVYNPSKYALYNDPLLGILDAHVFPEMKEGFAKRAKEMKALADKGGRFAYLFETMYRLADVLSVKATLGIDLVAAYKKGDKAELLRYANEVIPATIEKMETFYTTFRKQWMTENKSFGFEVMGIRLGGGIQRLKETATVIKEYLNGEIDRIEELERERLSVAQCFEKGDIVCFSSYLEAASGSWV